MIVKYKLVNGKVPSNIVDGGYFMQGDYLIGKAIPMEQEIITKDQLLSQVLAQHAKTPYKKFDNVSSKEVKLTVEEVTAMVNGWAKQRGE